MRVNLAKLDSSGVLRGFEEVEIEDGELGELNPAEGHCVPLPKGYELPPGRVAVPTDCDLNPGTVSWDGRKFATIKKSSITKSAPTESPDAVIAIARGFQAIRDSGLVELPEITLAWLRWWEKTIDGVRNRR